MGGPIDMNVGEFWETSVSFLKRVVLEKFSRNIVKIMSTWMSKVVQNTIVFKKKTGCFSVFRLDVTSKTICSYNLVYNFLI